MATYHRTQREGREYVSVSLLMPADLAQRIDSEADRETISRSAWIRRAAAEALPESSAA